MFSNNVYALLYPSATLSFVFPLVAGKLNVLQDVLMKPFSVTTPVVDSVVAKRVFRSFPISFHNTITLVDLIELDMVEFDVILGWIDCILVLLP